MALEVGLADIADDEPGRVTLLGRTRDPRIVAAVCAHLSAPPGSMPRAPLRLVVGGAGQPTGDQAGGARGGRRRPRRCTSPCAAGRHYRIPARRRTALGVDDGLPVDGASRRGPSPDDAG
jgi:hypothetical protein